MIYICHRYKHLSLTYIALQYNPLPDDKTLGLFKLKHIADDILGCIKNGK